MGADGRVYLGGSDGKDGRPCRASATLGRAGCIDQGVRWKTTKNEHNAIE
ncbi:hypothetical protein KKJ09_14265 [Xenorhabdus bovienii]|nr:hypothetical protein [Xenorhabdus bovienii]MDE9494713.1 hypothetical protein [Xenorhabdus bovienii]MDE9503080.1 hypothetical protein [Xenorhabdus bovienii]MDE9526873.1 hypothetical protein [Xenorhabdus bovienii]